MKILVTGCAGFIGFHVVKHLLKKKIKVYGIDYLSNKKNSINKFRLNSLRKLKDKNFFYHDLDITNYKKLSKNFNLKKYECIIHLAAEAGVRKSHENPFLFFNTNLKGFMNIIHCSKNINVKHLIFASSSSVYGNNVKFPTKENFVKNEPSSFYGATKICNEVIAYSFSYNYNMPCTGLRFYTVYGPFGRPDMAIYKFTKNIINNKYFDLYNFGNDKRDFTYIEDVINSIDKLINKIPKKEVPFRVINIGSSKTTSVKNLIVKLEQKVKNNAKYKYKNKHLGDVDVTHSNTEKLKKLIKYSPKTGISEGIDKFIKWYKQFNIKNNYE